jgi:hypothetical protein
MSDYRSTHSTGGRSDGTTRRRTPGHLTALSLTRRRPGLFGHGRTVLDILLRSRLPDLAKMGIGIENRLGRRATGNQKNTGEQKYEQV